MSVVEYDKTNVLVTYLPQNFTEMKFQELVASVGHLQSFRLIMRTVDGTKVNLGYGFAKYENEEAAAKAVKVLHGLHIQNKKIKVTYARKQCESLKDTNLYVSGLPRSMTESQLLDLFKPYGTIISHRLLYHPADRVLSRGIGFVRFNTTAEARAAAIQLADTVLPGADRRLHVRPAHHRHALGVRRAVEYAYVLYVANFSCMWTESVIYWVFSRWAPIAKVVVHRTGAYRCAFVTVWQYQNAIKLIRTMNGRCFEGRQLRVSFKK